MADKKISALTSSSTPLTGTEVLPIVQSSATVKVAVSDLTAGRAVSASSFTPSGSTVPANGMYLPAANEVAFATNTILRASIKSTGDMKWSDNGASGENAMVWERLSGTGASNSGRLKLAYNSVSWTPASLGSVLYWDGNTGGLTISTSSQKYKRNITPVTDAQLDKALLLKPSYYQRLEYDYWEYGLIAEEVSEIGLDEFVTKIDDEISGLNYEKMVTLAFGLIQRQAKKIDDLTQTVADLQAKVN